MAAHAQDKAQGQDPAQDAPPTGPIGQIISYQGLLSDNAGKPVADGQKNLTFKIYENGTERVSQTVTVATVGGVFNAFFSVGNFFFNTTKSYELGITFNGAEVKHPLAAVPVAVSAARATLANAANAVVGATPANTPDRVVKRDENGDFAAGTVTVTGLSFGTGTTQTTPFDPDKVVQLTPPAPQTITNSQGAINLAYGPGTNPDYFARFGVSNGNIGPSSPARNDQFLLKADGGFLAQGDLGYGTVPKEGKGSRMMWYPYKTAFRAGQVSGTQWDDPNIGFYSTALGNDLLVSGFSATAMGNGNTVSSSGGLAVGGSNTVSGNYAVALGALNTASGNYSTAMGYSSVASGQGAIALGYDNAASANYSVALGQHAITNGHLGSFVFSDASTNSDFLANANNQFSVRAAGGARFFSSATLASGVLLAPGGGSWSSVSDRNAKENFAPVDSREVLRRVVSMPISTWNYKTQAPSIRHIGPMAQDFHAAFNVGEDDKRIATIDPDGVAFAAIQGLNAELQARDAKIAQLEAANAAFEARLKKLEAKQ